MIYWYLRRSAVLEQCSNISYSPCRINNGVTNSQTDVHIANSFCGIYLTTGGVSKL